MPLDREEYVEQAYFFQTLRERMQQEMSTQDLLDAIRQEVLATTMLPFALDFMAGELRLTGGFATAMARLPHYFTPFQTYVVGEAEKAEGRFDFRIALEILQREVEYRAGGASPQGIFLYQFETLCRNRLGYDRGLEAMAGDSIFDENWREWILTARHQVGLIDFGDMIYVRSELYRQTRGEAGRLQYDDSNLYQYHLQFGVLTINEVRVKLGLPPVPWGDKPTSPADTRSPQSTPGGSAGEATHSTTEFRHSMLMAILSC